MMLPCPQCLEELESRLLLADGLTITADAPIVLPAYDTIGINVVYSGDDNKNASATIEYRTMGGQWQMGHYGLSVQASYYRSALNRTEFASRLFDLDPDTQYEVRVTIADPDGVSGANPRIFTVATRAEPVVANTAGTLWHVDPTRGTNGSGTAGSPFNNIAAAETAARAGDTVLLYSGEYVLGASGIVFDQIGTPAAPIIFKAAPGATPVIRGPKTLDIAPGATWQAEAGYPGVYWVSMASKPQQVYHEGNYLGWCDTVSNLSLGKCLNNSTVYDIGTYGGWAYDATAKRLYVKIPATWNNWSGATQNPTASGVQTTYSGSRGFIPQGKHLVFEGLTFRYFDKAFFLNSTSTSGWGEGLVVRNSSFEHIVNGIYAYQNPGTTATSTFKNVLIDGCRFITSPTYGYRDWTLGHDVYATQGIYFATMVGSTGVIRNSTFDSVENGIFIGQNNPNEGMCEANAGWVIQDNYFTKIGDDSIELEGAAYNQVVMGNLMTYGHTAFSLAPGGTGPTWILRNTIYFSDWLDPEGSVVTNGAYPPPYEIFKFNSGYNFPSQASLAVVYHNSIQSNTSFTSIAAMLSKWGTVEGMWFISRNNSYSLVNGSGHAIRIYKPSAPESLHVFDADYDNVWIPDGHTYATIWWQETDTTVIYPRFADLQAGGVEVHGTSFLPTYADPLGGDFTVPAGTFLHDGGVYIPGINDGYQGAAPDIGAYEAPGLAPTRYVLSVADGSGDGEYAAGTVIPINASIPAGSSFDRWVGDTSGIADIYSPVTTITMPDRSVTIDAEFAATVYTVGSGQTYGTIQAAVNAACQFPAADAVVRIMDDGVYNEYINLASGVGNPGVKLTIEAAPGMRPTIYGLTTYADFDVTLRGLTIDGRLRSSGGSPAAASNVLYLRGNGNQTIEDCIIYGRGTDSSSGGTTALYGNSGTTVTFRNNVFETDTMGVYPYDGAGGAVIEGNTFKGDTGVNWARVSVSAPVMVRNNLFLGCRLGFQRRTANPAGNVTIENNTFYRCGGPTNYTGGAILVRDFTGGDFGPTIRDNLIVGKGAASAEYVSINTYTTATTILKAQNNGFYDIKVSGGLANVAYVAGAWKTLAQINAYSGASGNIVGASDPFMNAAGGDFQLKPASWAATAASDGSFIGALGVADAVPPEVLSLTINDGQAQRTLLAGLTFAFSEDVSASLAADDLELVNTATSQTISTAGMTLAYAAATNTASWQLPALPDGTYSIRLKASGIADAAGNALAGGSDYLATTFQLIADVTGDNHVDDDDLSILLANWGSGTAPQSGELSGDAQVSDDDLSLLLANWGRSWASGGMAALAGVEEASAPAAIPYATSSLYAAAAQPYVVPPLAALMTTQPVGTIEPGEAVLVDTGIATADITETDLVMAAGESEFSEEATVPTRPPTRLGSPLDTAIIDILQPPLTMPLA